MIYRVPAAVPMSQHVLKRFPAGNQQNPKLLNVTLSFAGSEETKKKELPKYTGENHFLSKEEQRVERQRARKGSSFLVAVVMALSSVASTVPLGKMFFEMKAEQLTREYQAAGDMDGPLLRAGDAAHGLLLAAEASEKNPLLGYLLRQQVEKHRDEWLEAMPEKARPQVVPILDAFIHGANAETLKQLIAKNSTFSLAKATPLRDVDLDDKDRAENVKQVKRLVEAGKGTDGFLRDSDYSIHYWYFPAQEGKQTLLFSNGRNATMLSSANLILKAVEEGYGFIQYEYPQNGESKGELSENGYYHATNLMYKFLTKTRSIPAEQIIDLGYSMGTNLASRLASLHPEVKTIALISPPEGFAKVYDEVIARHKGTLAAKLAVNSEILDAFNTAKLFEDGKIKGKTILIVYGEKDDYVLPKETIALAKLAEKHNTVIYVPIPGEGHSSIRSTPSSLDLIFKLMKRHLPIQE